MDDMIKKYFNVDRKYTTILFYSEENPDVTILTKVDDFKALFSEPLQKAVDNGTDAMDEIRAFDPDNSYGYNNLII